MHKPYLECSIFSKPYSITQASTYIGGLPVMIYLFTNHCDKGEYISIAADQGPPDQRDWDVESEASVTEREHDESNGNTE